MNQTGIYCIKNKLNGKLYVGSAICIDDRWRTHRLRLKKQNHHSIVLQRAWNKYGSRNFEFTILEELQDATKLLIREQYWMDYYKSYLPSNGYNINPTAGSNKGLPPYKRTVEHREKMRLACLGKKVSKETRLKISLSRLQAFKKGMVPWNRGKKHTPESIEKMRQKKFGNKFGLGNKNFLGKIPWNKGIKYPKEQLEKFRKSLQRNNIIRGKN